MATTNGANLGFESQLWAAADKLRGHMDASEYKHVGAAAVEDDGAPFEGKMAELTTELYEQFEKAKTLEAAIRRNLAYLGWEEM